MFFLGTLHAKFTLLARTLFLILGSSGVAHIFWIVEHATQVKIFLISGEFIDRTKSQIIFNR